MVPPHHLATARVRQDLPVWLADPVSEDAISLFADGVYLRNEADKTRPAELEILGSG